MSLLLWESLVRREEVEYPNSTTVQKKIINTIVRKLSKEKLKKEKDNEKR